MNRTFFSFLLNILVFFVLVLGVYFIVIYKTTIVITGDWLLPVRLYIAITGIFLLSRFLILVLYRDDHSRKFENSDYPSVSFIIAAKNEGDSIFKTIEACMESKYPAHMECIAIDDGSTDATAEEMRRAAVKYDGLVKVISFEHNQGKREAMAEGILVATGEVVIFVDSDSFLEKDAARHIVEHLMTNPSVGAVSGNSGVDNETVNTLTKMQSARYGISFDIFKVCESVFGTVTCCPGCFSAYRRSALMEVLSQWRNQMFLGTRSTFGDDRSLTNFVLKKWKVIYCEKAYATTIVPEKYSTYLKQQMRWKKSWIREGTNAAKFMWKKHPVASLSFYSNFLIPIFSPVIVFYAVVLGLFIRGVFPTVFFVGLISLSLLYGLYYYWRSKNGYWWYVVPYAFFYVFILVWQMPYAVLRLKDTKWGTR